MIARLAARSGLHALVVSAMRDLMPAGGALPGVEETPLEPFVERLCREADPLFVVGLYLGTLLYVGTPAFTVGVPLPSPLLSARLRDRHAQRLCSSSVYTVRQGVTVLRMVAGLCWGMDPRVRERVGVAAYGPDPGSFRQAEGPAKRALPLHAQEAP